MAGDKQLTTGDKIALGLLGTSLVLAVARRAPIAQIKQFTNKPAMAVLGSGLFHVPTLFLIGNDTLERGNLSPTEQGVYEKSQLRAAMSMSTMTVGAAAGALAKSSAVLASTRARSLTIFMGACTFAVYSMLELPAANENIRTQNDAQKMRLDKLLNEMGLNPEFLASLGKEPDVKQTKAHELSEISLGLAGLFAAGTAAGIAKTIATRGKTPFLEASRAGKINGPMLFASLLGVVFYRRSENFALKETLQSSKGAVSTLEYLKENPEELAKARAGKFNPDDITATSRQEENSTDAAIIKWTIFSARTAVGLLAAANISELLGLYYPKAKATQTLGLVAQTIKASNYTIAAGENVKVRLNSSPTTTPATNQKPTTHTKAILIERSSSERELGN